jgi:predicted dehydrogenase
VLEKCCHDFDLVNWLTGSVPVRIASFGGRDFFVPENAKRIQEIGPSGHGAEAYSAWRNPSAEHVNPFTSEAELCDNQVAIIEYANGIRATFHTNSNAGLLERRMYILGSHGALRADAISGIVETRPIGWEPKSEFTDTNIRGGHAGGDEVMTKALVGTLLRGDPPLASVDEGLRSAIVAFGMDEAQEKGQVVDLSPLWKKAGIDPRS